MINGGAPGSSRSPVPLRRLSVRIIAGFAAAALAVPLVVIPASASNPKPVSFKNPVTYSAGTTCPNSHRQVAPTAVTSADVNADGKADLVVGIQTSGEGNNSCFSVLLGTGRGNFGKAKLYSTNGWCQPSDPAQPRFRSRQNLPLTIKTGDLNGDGKPDVVTGGWGDNCVGVFMNTTRGVGKTATFAAAKLYGSCADYSGPGWISLADMDRDGDTDITVVAGNEDAQAKASVLVNNGRATFRPSVCKAPYQGSRTGVGLTNVAYPQNLVNADVNGDAKVDIVSMTQLGNLARPISVQLARSTASAPYWPAQTVGWAGSASNPTLDAGAGITAGDVNNDGRPDLLIAAMGSSEVVVLANTTPSASHTASFVQGATISVQNSQTIATADMNGDGNLDIVSTATQVLLGRGNGTFAPAQTFPVDDARYATVARITAGLPSMVAIDNNLQKLHVFVNTTPVPPLPPKHKQTADLKCGPPPFVKARGLTLLLCPTFTNIGNPVSVNLAGRLRGDVSGYFRKIVRPDGRVYVQTYGYPLVLRVSYNAPGSASFRPYVESYQYKT